VAIGTPDAVSNAQWNYIVALLTTEAQPGGRIAGVNYVGTSFSLWTTKGPHVGVQLKQSPLSAKATNQREMNAEFWIITGVQSTAVTVAQNMPGTNAPPNLDDAMNQVRSLVGNGNGKGIVAIFNDGVNYTLGGNATKVVANPPIYDWKDELGGQKPEIWAYALVKVMATSIVWVPGAS
jgi:hypothetical protein